MEAKSATCRQSNIIAKNATNIFPGITITTDICLFIPGKNRINAKSAIKASVHSHRSFGTEEYMSRKHLFFAKYAVKVFQIDQIVFNTNSYTQVRNHTNANFVTKVLPINRRSLAIIEHIQVKSRLNVKIVANAFLKYPLEIGTNVLMRGKAVEVRSLF